MTEEVAAQDQQKQVESQPDPAPIVENGVAEEPAQPAADVPSEAAPAEADAADEAEPEAAAEESKAQA